MELEAGMVPMEKMDVAIQVPRRMGEEETEAEVEAQQIFKVDRSAQVGTKHGTQILSKLQAEPGMAQPVARARAAEFI